MERQSHLDAVFVEFIPETIEPGKLYVSHEYATATHLCACGCGQKVVTPLSQHMWDMTEIDGKVTLSPSILNTACPFKAHYWIVEGDIRWT